MTVWVDTADRVVRRLGYALLAVQLALTGGLDLAERISFVRRFEKDVWVRAVWLDDDVGHGPRVWIMVILGGASHGFGRYRRCGWRLGGGAGRCVVLDGAPMDLPDQPSGRAIVIEGRGLGLGFAGDRGCATGQVSEVG